MKESTQEILYKISNTLIISLSFTGIFTIIYEQGFYHNHHEKIILNLVISFIFFLSAILYFIRFIRDKKIFKSKKINYIIIAIIAFLIFDFILFFLWEYLLWMEAPILHIIKGFILFFIHLAIFIQLFHIIVRYNKTFLNLKFRSSVLIIGSFGFTILIGTLLLMMPKSVTIGHHISFTNALFTATSAVCVTGLIVVDTATYFSSLGQTIIIVLIQIGGLGIITIIAFMVELFGNSFSMEGEVIVGNILNDDKYLHLKSKIKKIILVTLGLELLGAFIIFFSWYDSFSSLSDAFTYSIFHSISAFCNAGFSLFTDGLFVEKVRNNYIIIYTIIFLIILGSLGFNTLFELHQKFKNKVRIKFSLQSKIILIMAALLTIIGAISIYALENNHALADISIPRKIMHSLFQSVTLRTTGFNTIDFSKLTVPTIWIMMFFMYIGGSPGSTAGGIKTTTLFISTTSIFSILKGEKRINLFGRNIPFKNLNNSLIIIFMSLLLIFISLFLLVLVNPQLPFMKLMFEEISAFGTVGLSLGITSSLSIGGKIIIILNMFIGRIGPLTLAMALGQKVNQVSYEYPEESVMVG